MIYSILLCFFKVSFLAKNRLVTPRFDNEPLCLKIMIVEGRKKIKDIHDAPIGGPGKRLLTNCLLGIGDGF